MEMKETPTEKRMAHVAGSAVMAKNVCVFPNLIFW